ncbi:MAG: hypothetical protein R3D30_12710 [Hyphomicrobiales bacterium]
MLEPQHDAIELTAEGEAAVPRAKLVLDRAKLATAGGRQMPDPDCGQLFERVRVRNGALVQHVAPWQHLGAVQHAPQQFARRIAVGDDEIGHPRPR